jgi:uncharacterized protein (DUF2141 family)
MRIALHLSIATVLVLCSTLAARAQQGGRTVGGARNDDGSIRCGLYNSPNGFREPGREFKGVAAPVKGGRGTCVFSGIPAGKYAVAVFHAEKNETRMETGMFGKPKQGYGFSRNPSSTFGPPGFDAAAFEYQGGNQNLSVQLNY